MLGRISMDKRCRLSGRSIKTEPRYGFDGAEDGNARELLESYISAIRSRLNSAAPYNPRNFSGDISAA
jgi:hypothetical protein